MEQRLCRWCLSPVQPAARRCPHCTASQNGWGHPSIQVAASVVLPLVFLGVLYFWILGPSTEFPEDGSALVVTSSSFHYEPFERSPGFVTCIGKPRNRSSVALEHPPLQVQ